MQSLCRPFAMIKATLRAAKGAGSLVVKHQKDVLSHVGSSSAKGRGGITVPGKCGTEGHGLVDMVMLGQ